MRRLRYLLVALVSALFLVAPYHSPYAWPLAFFAFVPAFRVLRDKSPSNAFQFFYVLGVFYHLLLGHWLTRVSVFGFLALAAYLSLYFAFFGLFARSFLYSNRLRASLTVGAIWTLLEYARSYLISGFPWALLGYSQWKNLPFIQIADVIGAHGVSFLVIWTNVLV
jgi:apolipoprotein N-acyltransferase